MSTQFRLIPRYAATDRRLGHADFRFLALLCGFCDGDDQCHVSVAGLASQLHMDISSVKHKLQRLARLGWIERGARAGKSSVTVVKFDHRPETLDDPPAANADGGAEA